MEEGPGQEERGQERGGKEDGEGRGEARARRGRTQRDRARRGRRWGHTHTARTPSAPSHSSPLHAPTPFHRHTHARTRTYLGRLAHNAAHSLLNRGRSAHGSVCVCCGERVGWLCCVFVCLSACTHEPSTRVDSSRPPSTAADMDGRTPASDLLCATPQQTTISPTLSLTGDRHFLRPILVN